MVQMAEVRADEVEALLPSALASVSDVNKTDIGLFCFGVVDGNSSRRVVLETDSSKASADIFRFRADSWLLTAAPLS